MLKIPGRNKKPRLYQSKRGFSSNHSMNHSPSRKDMGEYLDFARVGGFHMYDSGDVWRMYYRV